MPRPTKYPPEFRDDAVQLVLSSPPRSVRVVARELGINHNTLQGWVDAERRKRAAAGRRRDGEDGELSADEREELKPA